MSMVGKLLKGQQKANDQYSVINIQHKHLKGGCLGLNQRPKWMTTQTVFWMTTQTVFFLLLFAFCFPYLSPFLQVSHFSIFNSA